MRTKITMKARQINLIPKEDLINRDESGRIIVKYATEPESLFQCLRKAIQSRKVDLEVVKKYYSIENETFKLLFV